MGTGARLDTALTRALDAAGGSAGDATVPVIVEARYEAAPVLESREAARERIRRGGIRPAESAVRDEVGAFDRLTRRLRSLSLLDGAVPLRSAIAYSLELTPAQIERLAASPEVGVIRLNRTHRAVR
jgi:hypothetical protein